MKTKIMIIDTDITLIDTLKSYFENEFFEVTSVSDGKEAINAFKRFSPDIVISEIILPSKDGFQICRDIREISQVPIIFISSKCEIFDKVLGLQLGADDYITKPFDIKELDARISAVLRRCSFVKSDNDDTVKYKDFEISLNRFELLLKGKKTAMPPKELELLYLLASNPNRVFNREQLLDKIWGFDYLGDSRTVDVHIKRIRNKIEKTTSSWSLETIWGVGYKFEVKEVK